MPKSRKIPGRKFVAKITGKRRGLLPGLLTTASLFISFYSIVAAIGGDYRNAAIAIIIAAFLDAFDGRVARFTNSSSSFGEHYDSLADVIAFGAAPAVLIYTSGLASWGNLGISIAFAYMACCCVRLARFSSNDNEGMREFSGMPSPTSGGFVAATVWCLQLYPIDATLGLYLMALVAIASGLLMVSGLPFISGRRFIIFTKHKVSVNTVTAIFYFALLATKPAEVLFISGCLYIAVATAHYVQQQNKKAQREQQRQQYQQEREIHNEFE